ncbi:MAG: SUMF1/EgtB/PvdO family nonheme iron enzyme [Caldilineaceae bacterium]
MHIPLPFLLQSVTPTPQIPFWQITQDRIPYVIILGVALMAFILGTVLRPLLEDFAASLQNWVKGWGKAGDFRRRYLTLLIGEHRHLSMLLSSNFAIGRWKYQRQSIELEELYTPLSLGSTQQYDRPTERRRRWLPERLQQLWRRIRPLHEPTAGEVGQVIWSHSRLVVRGDPGSGKSTLLRYLALTCARSLSNDRQDADRRTMVKLRLGWRQRPFPILVMLNRLADVTTWPENRRLLDEIVEMLPSELSERYPKGFFERQLERGNCLVLFDGFDELGSRAARGKMARLIANLADSYSGRNNHFLVSTRIVGYEGQLDNYGFTARTVQPLDSDSIQDLVQRRYEAIAVGEGVGRSIQEQEDLKRRYQERAQLLLNNLRRNQGLRQLTDNPLLLSLIVLVHMVKIELPEQRHLLYRDCVEILTENWQASKRGDSGLERKKELHQLPLQQKIVLLQNIALTMQNRRKEGESQALIRREEVEAIIAAKLPGFIAAHLPEAPDARQQECEKLATRLLDNIHEESGILLEKGLDEAGEPLVSFSHLTFQEYLAADAIRERTGEFITLSDNLFNPSWREVLLLYVEMVEASDVVQSCLDASDQHPLIRYLLAGRCLVEQVNVQPQLRQQVTEALRSYFCPEQENLSVQDLIWRIGSETNYDWLIGNLSEQLSEQEKQQLSTPLQLRANSPYEHLRKCFLRLIEESPQAVTRVTIGSVLSGIGDPRDFDEMILVPAGPFLMGSNDSDDYASASEKPQHMVTLEPFLIGKYPVTNAQYWSFVKATQCQPPRHWQNGEPQPWLLTHPVTYVSWHDAQAYCRWRSEISGQTCRLPTEAEWEKAARGTDGRTYPWGDEAPTDLHCNFYGNVGTTTSVGIYSAGVSPYGLYDMAGNVLEWNSTKYKAYPYDAKDGREELDGEDSRLLRGGAWFNSPDLVRGAYRDWFGPDDRLDGVGFRVAISVSPGS